MESVRHISVPVLAGIIVLKSAKMARYMNEHVAGVHVPEQLIREMDSTQDKDATAVEIASRSINGVKKICRGVHIMPLGKMSVLGRILDASGL
jgi:5,10-methylenetetrahydrofolate reductase